MNPESSWTDRLLPDWMGGSSGPAGSTAPEASDQPEHRRLVSRIEQLREGLERAAAALPEEHGALGRRAVEAGDELAARARAAADRSPEEAVPALRDGKRALHEAHFQTVKIRVARDREEEAESEAAREALEATLEELDAAASSLEELAAAGGRDGSDGG